MELISGQVDLTDIFEFAQANEKQPGGHDRPVQLQYNKAITKTVSSVPEKAGWYIWGYFENNEWSTVYLGKTSKQKTSSLRTRLFDEIRQECVAFWSAIYGHDYILNQHKELYDGKWYNDALRAIRKEKTKHILWVASVDEINDDKVTEIECVLIKIVNPSQNVVRKKVNLENQDALSTR